ncbi:MAG: Leucine-tRNA ligase [Candidatus Collierbacteria bacterium GW2011_GWA1_44_12]|uniref:Leucine--tRNA ligase n=2 Tax=Candidatus Collieribacteriota TaxID=1752725 RepID=A0A0G1GLF8_9BACT|nr:MAG: Leucine-tRNA ligase [Candidatus Collierbacteria bacterium GW2011_GWA1_44_12]
MAAYDFKEIEAKWNSRYEEFEGYEGVDFKEGKEKFFMLTEFPYPSGSGLHVGHAFSMTGADVYARFMRMKGKNVMFPMGWDAFGLPTENYAIKTGIKPQEATKENTEMYKRQMKQMGFSFDWKREINTTLPDYYKWTQWIFVKLFEKGLAEKQEIAINWCPKDKIGLANEEVINGKCERCGTQVERRTQSQWVVKITAYADRLIEGLKNTEFIEKVKAAQINWIDRKEGAKIIFKLADGSDELEVFTTRPDTLEGATFMVVSPEHKIVERVMDDQLVAGYVEEAKKKSDMERAELNKEKTGVFSGLYAINPLTQKEIPVWIADYVLSSYGTGAIMSVPSHDERDGEFAKKYNLEINWTYQPDMGMIDRIENEGWGKKAVNYHLRDWIFSRQHYWGEPIPMVYCEKDGWVSVPEDQLPVILPEIEKYQPTDNGESPLANIPEWVKTVCPRCGSYATRETDTMPNWAGSDWYFLRFCDPKNENVLADMEKMKYWLPVDIYVGGDEHNTLHLLYSRFIYQFLWDLGVVPNEYPEPYKKRLSHGIILGPDGNKMSKSKENVILPDVVANAHGADTLRAYMMFMGPFDATMTWNESSLLGVKRFLDRFYKYVGEKIKEGQGGVESDREIKVVINRLVSEVGADLESFKFNTTIAKIMTALNRLEEGGNISNDDLKKLVQVLSPIAPFVAEDLWENLGGEFSIHGSVWPSHDKQYLVDETVTVSVQVNGKLRGTIVVSPDAEEPVVRELAEKQERISGYLTKGEVKKVIYIQGKTINFVVG